jgi:hypothetical protein
MHKGIKLIIILFCIFIAQNKMGNLQSTKPIICEICNKQIHLDELLICVRCEISLHESCYRNTNDNNKNYTQCPKCERVGCIGKYRSDD